MSDILYNIFRFSLLAVMLCMSSPFMAGPASAQAMPLSTPACDWGPNPCDNFVYATQGIPLAIPVPYQSNLATVSYPGNSSNTDSPLVLPDGECLYIVNSSAATYFVPLRTQMEWDAFVANKPPGVAFLSCGPGGGSGSPTTDGACGSASAAPSSSAPAAHLCSIGTASSVTGTGPWSWTCTGDGDGPQSTALCQAPAACAPATTTTTTAVPSDIVIIVDASGSMQMFDNEVTAAAQNIVPQFMAANPLAHISVIVLGGSGYTPGYNGAATCHYGEVYDSVSGLGSANGFGLNGVTANSNTPIAAAITYAGTLLNRQVLNGIVVFTDGAETCGGDVAAAVQAQQALGTKVMAIAYQDPSYNIQSFAMFTSTVTASSTQLVVDALTGALTQVASACP